MIQSIDTYRHRIPTALKKGMRIDGLIYADRVLLKAIEADQTLEQVANVAMLPGLVGQSLAMPDAHQGYGFCIGGVAASDLKEGVVSAGGVGFDINCGVRLLACEMDPGHLRAHLEPLLATLFRDIPAGRTKSPVAIWQRRTGKCAAKGGSLDDRKGIRRGSRPHAHRRPRRASPGKSGFGEQQGKGPRS